MIIGGLIAIIVYLLATNTPAVIEKERIKVVYERDTIILRDTIVTTQVKIVRQKQVIKDKDTIYFPVYQFDAPGVSGEVGLDTAIVWVDTTFVVYDTVQVVDTQWVREPLIVPYLGFGINLPPGWWGLQLGVGLNVRRVVPLQKRVRPKKRVFPRFRFP